MLEKVLHRGKSRSSPDLMAKTVATLQRLDSATDKQVRSDTCHSCVFLRPHSPNRLSYASALAEAMALELNVPPVAKCAQSGMGGSNYACHLLGRLRRCPSR